MTEENREKLNLIASVQLLRAAMKLQKRLHAENNKLIAIKIFLMASKVYEMMGIKETKQKTGENIQNILNRQIVENRKSFDIEDIFDLINEKIDVTDDFNLDQILKRIAKDHQVSESYETSIIKNQFVEYVEY